MRINCKNTFLVGAFAASLVAINAQAGLIHRYSFNDATNPGKDSAGTATATLVNINPQTDITTLDSFTDPANPKYGVFLNNLNGSALYTSGDTNGHYITLPTNALNTVKSAVTFEFWTELGNAVQPSAGTWSRVFDFGDPYTKPGRGENYIMFTPHSGTPDSRAEFQVNEVGNLVGNGSPSLEGYHHVAVVFDSANHFMEMYIDGLLAPNNGHTTTSFQLTNLSNKAYWIGRSEWSGDQYLYGSIDEFRIYDRALSGVEVAADYFAGSDTANPPVSTLGNYTGITIQNKISDIVEKYGSNTTATAAFDATTNGIAFTALNLFNAPGFVLKSSNTNVATIDQAGNIKALIPGTTTISATWSNKTDSFVLTVDPDTTKPVVTKVDPKGYDRLVQVAFSKPVDPVSAQNTANYVLNGGAQKVNKAVLNTNDNKTVTLYIDKVDPTAFSTIVISNVKDTDFTPNVMDSATFSYLPAAGSPLTRRFYYQSAGYNTGAYRNADNTLAGFNITANPDFPHGGNAVSHIMGAGKNDTGTYAGLTDGGGYGDNYISVIDGILLPAESGSYLFFIASDDDGAVIVGSDATEASLPTVYSASEAGWTGTRNYIAGSSDDHTTQVAVNLTAGQKYYFRVINRNGTGGDNLDVAWQTPSGAAVKNGDPAITAQYLADPTYTPTPMTITAQPSNTLVSIGNDAVFTVGISSKPKYTGAQWYVNNTPVTNGTGLTLTVPQVTTGLNSNSYYVVVSNLVDCVTSTAAMLTISSDTNPPVLVSAIADQSVAATNIVVHFNKRLMSSTIVKANFTIAGLTVANAVFDTNTLTNVFVTTTAPLVTGQAYTLTVNNVKDTGGNKILANSKITFHAADWAPGFCVIQVWNWSSSAADDILTHRLTAPTPDVKWTFPLLGTLTWENGDNFSTLTEGLLVPPQDGDYVFYDSSDDQSNFYLDTIPGDMDPANLVRQCYVSGWAGQRSWTDAGSDGHQISSPVTLQAGKRYYYRATWREGGGGDGLCVDWALPGTTTPIDITGSALLTLANGDLSSLTIVSNPVSQTKMEGENASFSVIAAGSSQFGTNALYQWYKNNTPITGATTANYKSGMLYTNDSGSQYYCVVSMPLLSQTSTVATLTVVPTTVPLTATAGAFDGSYTVGMRFNRLLDPATIDPANFSIAGGYNVVSIQYLTNANLDSIHGDALAVTVDAPVTADLQIAYKGVADIFGHPSAATVGIAIVDTATVDVGTVDATTGISDPMIPGVTIPTGADSYHITAGGSDIWGNADHFQFVYKTVSGDFDAIARVANLHAANWWSKAGLMIRNTTNASSAAIYQMTTPTAGQNTWAAGIRLADAAGFGDFPLAITDRRPTPSYPNAWVKVERRGQVFTILSSTDGKVWQLDGKDDLSASATQVFSDSVVIGLGVTSHDNSTNTAFTVSDIYDFSVAAPQANPPQLSATIVNGSVVISWATALGQGFSLFGSDDLSQWSTDSSLTPADDGAGTTSVTISPAKAKQFYQLKKQ